MEVPPQDVVTRDNVTVKVNAVIYFRVVEPIKAVLEVTNFLYATSQVSQTTLRSVLGEAELDELLSQREKLNVRLQSVLDQRTGPWGVKVTMVEVKQVDLAEQMIRVIASAQRGQRDQGRRPGGRAADREMSRPRRGQAPTIGARGGAIDLLRQPEAERSPKSKSSRARKWPPSDRLSVSAEDHLEQGPNRAYANPLLCISTSLAGTSEKRTRHGLENPAKTRRSGTRLRPSSSWAAPTPGIMRFRALARSSDSTSSLGSIRLAPFAATVRENA
jgi:SPFH domain / Band 7 family